MTLTAQTRARYRPAAGMARAAEQRDRRGGLDPRNGLVAQAWVSAFGHVARGEVLPRMEAADVVFALIAALSTELATATTTLMPESGLAEDVFRVRPTTAHARLPRGGGIGCLQADLVHLDRGACVDETCGGEWKHYYDLGNSSDASENKEQPEPTVSPLVELLAIEKADAVGHRAGGRPRRAHAHTVGANARAPETVRVLRAHHAAVGRVVRQAAHGGGGDRLPSTRASAFSSTKTVPGAEVHGQQSETLPFVARSDTRLVVTNTKLVEAINHAPVRVPPVVRIDLTCVSRSGVSHTVLAIGKAIPGGGDEPVFGRVVRVDAEAS
eukprot:scaffold16441_cov79-Phaeocystis_antarctica.AAC.3